MIAHLAAAGIAAAAPPEELAVRAELAPFVGADRMDAVVEHLDAVAETTAAALAGIGQAPPADLRAALYRRVAENLAKRPPPASVPGLPTTEADLVRTVLDYEGFRLERYVTAGVAPKRYFGWFDLAYDTSVEERAVRNLVACAVEVINAERAAAGDPLRITEAEVAVTFFAEGGALLVEGRRHDGILPVGGIGLDHIGYGVQSYRDAASVVDLACGTDVLGTLVWSAAGTRPTERVVRRIERSSDPVRTAWLTRTWTLEEAVAGTALMWLWEKELAAGMLDAAGREGLASRSADDRFVITSMVYNSGELPAEHTLRTMVSFATGERLAEQARGRTSGRLVIDLVPPRSLLAEVVAGAPERPQPTGWLSIYNVMQRYGAWVALHRFTAVFDPEDRWLEPGIPGTCPPGQEER